MPRRPPRRPRAAPAYGWVRTARGLPGATADALDRLELPGLDAVDVAVALEEWRLVVSRSRAELSAPHNDWAEFVGPAAREVLEDALRALPRRPARPLRTEVERLDALFEAKTSHNPFADPSRPWWARRWWH